jgi:plastocyanin
VLAAGVCALAAAGCSSVKHSDADLVEGKKAFVAKCGACHTLSRAGTKGSLGPNLDVSFQGAVEVGERRSSIRSVVEGQVEHPNHYGVMPANLASGATLANIAAYIAESAAKPGHDTGLLAATVQAPGSGKPAQEKAGKLEIAADPTGQLSYVTKKANATTGAVTISMPNMSGVSHNIAVEAGSHEASGTGPAIAASSYVSKGVASIKVTLKPGSYTFFCQAPGHRAAGMFGQITVK